MHDSLPDAARADTDARLGFFGKIPSRGDFVRAGLPRGFIDPWDSWLQEMLHGSRIILGEAWLPAWMEAPVWRFLLRPGACGPDAVLGVLMPSVDRAGRLFPLSLAQVARDADALTGRLGWLDIAEAAGRAALEDDIEPDALLSALQLPAPADAAALPAGKCAWWTDGSPRVPATAFATPALPDASRFARMLDAERS